MGPAARGRAGWRLWQRGAQAHAQAQALGELRAQIEALRMIAAGDRHTAAAAKLGISESALKAN